MNVKEVQQVEEDEKFQQSAVNMARGFLFEI